MAFKIRQDLYLCKGKKGLLPKQVITLFYFIKFNKHIFVRSKYFLIYIYIYIVSLNNNIFSICEINGVHQIRIFMQKISINIIKA